ncbi:phage tail assembly chaperone G [Clostridium saccharoperbutylacetonicum]|uniref:phage tail assembly chaperone G n=1 Tax=Clostridium saccharoperbutylacetonicum TaxID=36745 RepID=UPI0039E8E38C
MFKRIGNGKGSREVNNNKFYRTIKSLNVPLRHDNFMAKIETELKTLETLGLERALNFKVTTYRDMKKRSKNMTIDLMINDSNKTFQTINFTGETFKKLLEVQKRLFKECDKLTPETYSFFINFIRECFGNKFTEDEFLKNMKIEDIYPLYNELTAVICNKMTSRIKQRK